MSADLFPRACFNVSTQNAGWKKGLGWLGKGSESSMVESFPPRGLGCWVCGFRHWVRSSPGKLSETVITQKNHGIKTTRLQSVGVSGAGRRSRQVVEP